MLSITSNILIFYYCIIMLNLSFPLDSSQKSRVHTIQERLSWGRMTGDFPPLLEIFVNSKTRFFLNKYEIILKLI